MMTKERIAAAVEKAPAVGKVLKKLASKVARGKVLPETLIARDMDYTAQRELEHLLGTIGRRTADGSVHVKIPALLREAESWREAMALFVRAKDEVDENGGDVFARLKLLEPKFAWVLDKLATNDEVQHFVAKPRNRSLWMRVFRGAVGRIKDKSGRSLVTLSQLGSDWLGDSKALRAGSLRRQLILVISALGADEPDKDERRILEEFMIIDNPYTSSVTVFAPIVITLENGVKLDFPLRLFEQGMGASFPLETVGLIKAIAWRGERCSLTTCENAAPFAALVGNRVPSVYTAGYPSLAVKMLLFLLSSDVGLKCVHAGDADLDGFRIAEEVGNYIDLEFVVAAEAQKMARGNFGIPLTSEQSRRAWAYLEKHPDFRFADDVRQMLSRGRWIEQESFGALMNEDGKGVE